MLPDEQARFDQAIGVPGIADFKGDNKALASFPTAHRVRARAQR
jgi:hypothetical protein